MTSRAYTTIARQYARDVVAGKVPACKWVRAACQRQLNDLAKFKGKDSRYRFNPKLTDKQGRSYQPADNLCAFVERLPHVKGPLAGQPIHLEPWQIFILTTVFGWGKGDGKRRFRRAYIEVPRGSGKSAISSALALYMLAADGEGGAEVYQGNRMNAIVVDSRNKRWRSEGYRGAVHNGLICVVFCLFGAGHGDRRQAALGRRIRWDS